MPKFRSTTLIGNIPPSEVPPNYRSRDGHKILVESETILGFEFEFVNFHKNESISKPRKSYISGNKAADNLISRLNDSVRTMCSLRKVSNNISRKVEAATLLVYSNCYDLGLIYAYADSHHFGRICVGIRKVLKCAGLDHMTSSESLYRASLKISPDLMAKKQIIQLGIKFLDPEQVRANRFRIARKPHDELRPFWNIFFREFNWLPLNSRKFIINNLFPCEKSYMIKIKDHLKSYFQKIYNPNGLMSDNKRSTFLLKNLFSAEKNLKRKQNAEENRHKVSPLVETKENLRTRVASSEDSLSKNPSKRRKTTRIPSSEKSVAIKRKRPKILKNRRIAQIQEESDLDASGLMPANKRIAIEHASAESATVNSCRENDVK